MSNELDEAALEAIEARPFVFSYGDERLEAPIETRKVVLAVAERDALIATIRSLRDEVERLQSENAEIRAALADAQADNSRLPEFEPGLTT